MKHIFNIKNTCFSGLLAFFSLAILNALFRPSGAEEPRPASSIENYDCGTLSLYLFLHLENHESNLKTLEFYLPSPSADGYSLAELRAAARRGGLPLVGVKLPKNWRIDRPVLAFLKRGPHGHYVVVRPIGHTGKLVQVFDSLNEPEIIDANELFNSPEWTGLALLPERPNWTLRVGIGALSITALALGLRLVAYRRRKSNSV